MRILTMAKVSGFETGFMKLVSWFIFLLHLPLSPRGEKGEEKSFGGFGKGFRTLVVVLVRIGREFDVEAQRAHFLDQHVEAFVHAGLEGVVAVDDRFIDLGSDDHVGRSEEHPSERKSLIRTTYDVSCT